jgi:heptosyltransferase-1
MRMSNESVSSYQHIAIIKLSSLGDIIHTLPAFHMLRHHYPEARISWLVEPAGARLLQNFIGIDEIITVNLKIQGFKHKCLELRKILNNHRHQFDLILDFQGLLKSAILARLLKGRVLGFHRLNLREPLSRIFYSMKADIFDENQHVIFKNIHLLHLLGISGPDIQYPLRTSGHSSRLASFLKAHSLEPGKFIILNIGGGWQSKLLDINQYIDIAEKLKAKYPMIILWGNEKERQLAERISESTGIPLSIYLDFDQLFDMIEQSALIITADTLAMHAADMMNTPSVGLFGPTSPVRNGSLHDDSVAIHNQTDCSFCYRKKCDKMICLETIHIDKIERHVSKIYEKYN